MSPKVPYVTIDDPITRVYGTHVVVLEVVERIERDGFYTSSIMPKLAHEHEGITWVRGYHFPDSEAAAAARAAQAMSPDVPEARGATGPIGAPGVRGVTGVTGPTIRSRAFLGDMPMTVGGGVIPAGLPGPFTPKI